MKSYQVNINGLPVVANYSEENINEIFLPLLKRLKDMQEKKKSRLLVMLAAPPGAGKSTLLSFLEDLSKKWPDLTPIQTIGMDGFHMRQEYLLSHTTTRDGREIPMVEIKGAPETFDLKGLEEKIREVAAGKKCGWPLYDRTSHNPVDDAIEVTGDIVLLEGNYLLLDMEGWDRLSDYADYTISVKADEDLIKKRLLERRILSGHDREESEAFVEFSDMANARLVLTKSKKADLNLRVRADSTYDLI
ncbi:MAG: nucleoside/nucleotide kinase family protein [Pseudobutyrivibrio sp.]|nr:nucleoside/nucleotide kinase family protein [Pseudobutyrivibrio sp.]